MHIHRQNTSCHMKFGGESGALHLCALVQRAGHNLQMGIEICTHVQSLKTNSQELVFSSRWCVCGGGGGSQYAQPNARTF